MIFNKTIITIILSCYIILMYGQNKDVLLKIGETNVTLDEFKYIYEKNNGKKANYSKESVDDYLNLYTKFKLKVEKARQLRIDTISELKTELNGYRKQLASTYLNDKEVVDYLLKELYERQKQDVEFSHIFLPVANNASQSTIDATRLDLLDIKSKIVGGMSFEQAAMKYSKDENTASKNGYMGYFTAKLPNGFYDLESALYNTPIGTVSDVIRSKVGFHLVKVINRRNAYGKVSISQILVSGDNSKLADSLYNALIGGASFNVLVQNFSIDNNSKRNQGKLAPFGINTYSADFEKAAFELTDNNPYSKPIKTNAGWHIIKLLEKLQPDPYEIFVVKMKSLLIKDDRFNIARQKLIDDIKIAGKFKQNKEELKRFVATLGEDFYTYKWTPEQFSGNTTLFSLGGNYVRTLNDFAEYCRKNSKTRLRYDASKPYNEVVDELYAQYIDDSVLDFEESNLEVKYPEFKSLMREYEEGILLFEITKMNVWDKANQDSIGLAQFYESNKQKYLTQPTLVSYDYKINEVDGKRAKKVYDYLLKNGWEKTIKKYNKKKTVVERNEILKELDSNTLKEESQLVGKSSALQFVDNKHTFTQKAMIQPERIKKLSEARGHIVSDFQDYLEREWVNSLEKEFPITIMNDVLQSIIK